jgi:hypothetical protein
VCCDSATASTPLTSQPFDKTVSATSCDVPLRKLLADESAALSNGEVINVKPGVSIQMIQTDRGLTAAVLRHVHVNISLSLDNVSLPEALLACLLYTLFRNLFLCAWSFMIFH